MTNDELKSLSERVLRSYRDGAPVIVLAKDGGVLHGRETLRTIADIGAGLHVLRIDDVDRQQFEASDLPEICEAARRVWLQDGLSKRGELQ